MAAKAKAKAKAKARAKAAIPPPADSGSSSDEQPEPKLAAPQKKFSGADREKFVGWRRGIKVWRRRYVTTSEAKLGSALMEAITDAAEEAVFARVPEGQETYTNIMEAMEEAYGEKAIPSTAKYIQEYQECKRGKRSLSEFLEVYKLARVKAINHGLQTSDNTDGVQLLSACDLTTTQQAHILTQLQTQSLAAGEDQAKPEFKRTMGLLELLAQVLEMQDQKLGTRKRQAAFMGQETSQPKALKLQDGSRGFNKGAKSKGKGKGLCWDWQQGTCQRGATCTFQHGGKGNAKPKGDGKGKGKAMGKGKGKSKSVCWDWQAGKCTRGAACWFGHEGTKGEGKGTAGGAPALKHEG